MRWMAWVLGVTVWLGLTGCGVNKSEHEAVKRRVATLEKRVRVLEGRAGARGKGAKAGRAKARSKGRSKAPHPRGKVTVEGDAIAVFVASDRHRLPVPGEIREGTFKALATFESGASPVEIGPITIAEAKTTLIRCNASVRKCVISEPE